MVLLWNDGMNLSSIVVFCVCDCWSSVAALNASMADPKDFVESNALQVVCILLLSILVSVSDI